MFYTYILASRPAGTLYTGHTDCLTRRVGEHRDGARPGFTARYGVRMLVWFERHDSREAAKRRESQIKKWNRSWKIRLIRSLNPDWEDLFESLFRPPPEALGPERLTPMAGETE